METPINDSREQVLIMIESTADWWAQNANEYPDDERNEISRDYLLEQYVYVENLPPDHPVFDKIYNMDEYDIERFKYTLSIYGFWGNEDPGDFIEKEVMLGVFRTEAN